MHAVTVSLLLGVAAYSCSGPVVEDGAKSKERAADAGLAADAGVRCEKPDRLQVPETCSAGWYLWDDRGGALSPDGGGEAIPNGDNRCYQRCTADDECADPQRPFCSLTGLYKGGDFGCNGTVRLCRCNPVDDCPVERP